MRNLLLASGVVLVTTIGPAAAFTRDTALRGVPVDLVRMVCDEWGRCWDQPGYGDYARPRYSYETRDRYWDRDEDGYGENERRRPSTKWERKGFCPPGQHKKGNC